MAYAADADADADAHAHAAIVFQNIAPIMHSESYLGPIRTPNCCAIGNQIYLLLNK